MLFVDDEPQVLESYQRTLFEKVDVDTAIGARKGLEYLENEGPYSVVVSDLRMPGMDGVEFLGQVREKAPGSVDSC